MLRGNPNGSHVLMGSFDSATGYSFWFLWAWNCSCPQGVKGGTALSLSLASVAQNPVRSWRGAGPAGPGSPNLLYRSAIPPRREGCGWGVWALACDKRNSTPARATMEP